MYLFFVAGLLATAYAEQVCYNPYDCFSSDEPFNSPAIQLPEHPNKINTKFQLYTHKNPGKPQLLDPLDPALLNYTNYNGSHPTIMFTHGYLGNSKEFWVLPLIEALLTKGDFNVILVDWSRGATLPYFQAAGNARLVGAQVHLMLKVLHQHAGMDFLQAHLIGQGVGAHVMGYAGRNLRRDGTPLGRISGTDVAGPFFEYRHEDVRLDETDAEFVDAIHTDTETIKIKGVGTKQNVGHVDFYPNGGTSQPGCWALDKGVVKWIACSHYRSMELFIESINSECPFRAYACQNWPDFDKGYCSFCPPNGCPSMGWNAIESKGQHHGTFYAKTNSKESFCAYHYNIKFMTGSGIFADLDGKVKVTLTGNEVSSETVEIPKRYYPAGSTQTLQIHTKYNHGDIIKVKIEHSAWLDNWYLYAVVLRPMWTDKAYTGCFKKWLNNKDNEADLKTGVEGNCPE